MGLVVGVCAALGFTGLPTALVASASATPAAFAFTQQPGDGTPNNNLATQPKAKVTDSGGNAVSGVSVSLALQVDLPTGQPSAAPTLACDHTSVSTDSSGVASFTGCKVSRGGLYKLVATVAKDSTTNATATSTQFFVSGPAQLAFTGQPQDSTASTVWSAQPQVTVEDAHGTALVSTASIGLLVQPPNSSSAGWSKLDCTTNPVTAASGVATFAGCEIDTAASGYTLYAVDTADNLLSAPSNAFDITGGSASKLVFTTQPAGAGGGQALITQPVVTAEDAGGNAVSGYDKPITLSITSGTGTAGAQLSCTTNPVTPVNGVATFAGCAINKAGTGYTLHAVDSSDALSATSNALSISSGSAAHVTFKTEPGGANGGSAFSTQPEVVLTDAGGNPVDGVVTLAIKSGTGTTGAHLTCTANPIATSNGHAKFAGCAIDKNGDNYTLTATAGTLSADSSAFDVTAGSAAQLAFKTTPTAGTGGTAFATQPSVKVLDSGGNPASGAVTLSIATGSGTPGASLDCASNPVSASSGLATFSGCSIDTVGHGYRLTATLVADHTVVTTSQAFDVSVGSPAQLAFTTQPGGGSGGTAWSRQPVVTIEDAGGNPVTSAASTIALAVTSGTGDGTLDCQDNALPTQQGVARFAGCSIDTRASAYTLTATATVSGSLLSVVSADFAVTTGDPARLVFSTQPDAASAGSAFGTQPRVSIVDRGGNVVTSDTSAIALSITSHTGTAGAALSCSSASATDGVAAYSTCAIDRAGAGYTLTATDNDDALSAESRSFSVVLAPPQPLGLAPTGVPLGQTFGGRLYGDNPTAVDDDVNSATGSLTFGSTDLRVAGIGEPLVVQRSYNSADATGGVFGRGWTSLFDIAVKVVPNQTETVRGEDGQQLVWTWDAVNNRWVAPPGAHASLTCGSKQCKLIRDDGTRVDVNLTANGQQQIVDYLAPDGLGLTFAWTKTNMKVTVGGGPTPYIVNGTLNSDGEITRIATSTRSVSYGYTNKLLTRATDALGNDWTYAYDGSGRLLSVTDPRHATRLLTTYSGNGRVASVQVMGSQRHADDTFAWDDATQTATRSALTMVDGSLTREDYVDQYQSNVLLSQRIPSGAITRYSYDAALHLIESQDPLGWVQQYTYDSDGNLTSQSSPISSTEAATVRMTYDGQHRVTAQTDADGNTTTYVYNGPWLATIRPPAAGNVQWTRFDYNSLGELVHSVGPSNQRFFTYDAHGNQTSVKVQDLAGKALNGSGTLFTYDEAGDRLSATDPLSHKTIWTYDAAGHVLSMKQPLGNPVTYTYDAAGDLSSTIGPDGKITTWSWDEGNLRRTTKVDGSATLDQIYDPSGDLLSETAPGTNRVTTYGYDAAGRNVSLTDPAGVTTHYTYDLASNRVAAGDSAGQAQTEQYDALGRPTRRVENGRVTLLRYDPVGNVVSSTDASGNSTTFGYNADNAVASAHNAAGTTTYAYDTAGNLISVVDPEGHTTAYAYDGMGRRLKTTAGGGTTTYTFDNASNVKTVTDPDGRTTAYTLDQLNRATTTTYTWAGHSTITVGQSYDSLGRRKSMTDSTGTHNYGYDNNGNLASVTTGSDVFSYDYTTDPGKILETYPDGTKVTYGLDDAQNVMSVQAGDKGTDGYVAASYVRNALRQTTGIAYSNGVLETRQLDQSGDVVDQSLTVGGQAAAQDAFTYDSGGNPLSQVNTVNGTVTTNRYGYDDAGRLNAFSSSSTSDGIDWPTVSNLSTSNDDTTTNASTTVAPAFQPAQTPKAPSGPAPVPTFTYDGNGNRLSATSGSGTTTSTFDGNDQLTSQSGVGGAATWTYDKSGNVLTSTDGSGTTSYEYDAAARLVKVTLPGGNVVKYSYDGDGNRVSKTSNGTTTQYLWDPANHVPQLDIERRASDHSLIRRYIYGDGPVAMQTPTATYFYHLDPQGSVTELTTSDGKLAAAYHYDGFGNVTVDGDGHGNPLLFQSEYLDSDTGLYYMRARNYDSSTGRFTQRDPKAAPVGAPVASPYAFANDRPTSLGDPTGETSIENQIFWSHNSTEANVGADVGLGVSTVKLGVAAYKGAVALSDMLSTKVVTAMEDIGSSVGTEARAASSGVEELASAKGALGALGDAGEAGSAGEALGGAGKALKFAGTGLAIAGLAVQAYITVEDCMHDTAYVCAADTVGLAIGVGFTVGCEFASAGAATVACGIIGAALAIAVPELIKVYGPAMVAGLTDGYNAVAGAVLAAVPIVTQAMNVAIDAATTFAEDSAGAIVSGFNTGVSAVTSGFWSTVGTLRDAGYTAAQLATTLATTFAEGAQAAITTLVDFGYQIGDIAVALADTFSKTAEQAAQLLKDTFNYTVAQVAGALKDAYDLAATQLATVLKDVDYAVDEVATGLKSAYDATAEGLATALDAVGYGVNQIAGALQDVYDLADQAVAEVFHDLQTTLNYTIDQVAGAMQTVFNDVDKAAATAMQFASYAADEVATALTDLYDDAAAVTAKILDDLSYTVNEVAGALHSVYSLADQAVAQVLENLNKTATQVADALIAVFTDPAQTVANLLNAVGFDVNAAATALKSAFTAGADAAAAYLNTAGYALAGVAGALQTVFTETADQVIKSLETISSLAVNAIATAVSSAFNYTAAQVADAFKTAGADIAAITGILKDAFGETAQEVAGVLTDTLKYTVDQIADVLGTAYGLATDAIEGILQAAGWAADAISSIGGAFESFGQDLADAASDAWDAITSIF